MQSWSCKVRLASWSSKATPINFDLRLSWLASLLHIWKLFFTNLRGVVCTHKFIFELTIFAEWAKCYVYKWFHSAIWLVLQEPGARSRQLFQGFLLPRFWGESLEKRDTRPFPLDRVGPGHETVCNLSWNNGKCSSCYYSGPSLIQLHQDQTTTR